MVLTSQDLLAGVNRPLDPNNLTDLEKKHLPIITAPDRVKAGEWFDVAVEVGKLLEHPNEQGHFIRFIDLYAGDKYLSRLSVAAGTTWPVLKARVRLCKNLGPLRALDVCNLHGAWEGAKDIEVV